MNLAARKDKGKEWVNEPITQANGSDPMPLASIAETPDEPMPPFHQTECAPLFLADPVQQNTERARRVGLLTSTDRLYATFLEEAEQEQGYPLGTYGPPTYLPSYAGALDPTSIQGW